MENELNLVEELRFFAKIVEETNGKLNLIMLSGQLFAQAADKLEELQKRIEVLEATIRMVGAHMHTLKRLEVPDV